MFLKRSRNEVRGLFMNDNEFIKAIEAVVNANNEFVQSILWHCDYDKDVRGYLEKLLKGNSGLTTADVYDEIAHIHGIPYLDDETKKVVYKYPQFKYKSDRHANKHICI